MTTTISKAGENDYQLILDIGTVSVEEAHRASCKAADMAVYMAAHYNTEAIKNELRNPSNIYHIIYCDGQAAGFSKIVFDAAHPNVAGTNTTKLDRIYLLKEFAGLKLGYELLQFNIALSKANSQSAMWLFTWTGNTRAIGFYKQTGFNVIGSHDFKITEHHYNPNYHMLLEY